MQQLFLKNKKKMMLGCTFNVQIELKKNYNSMIVVSRFSEADLNVGFKKSLST